MPYRTEEIDLSDVDDEELMDEIKLRGLMPETNVEQLRELALIYKLKSPEAFAEACRVWISNELEIVL